MDRDFGYVQNGYQKENFIGGQCKKELLYASKRTNSKRYCGTEIQGLHYFQRLGKKFDDKITIFCKMRFFKFFIAMKRPNRLDFTPEEIEALIARIENQQLEADDFPLLADLVRAMIWMESSLKEKNLSIARLKAIFGIKTESANKLAGLLNQTPAGSTNREQPKDNTGGTPKDKESPSNDKGQSGHGHRPSSDYQEAKIINVPHESLEKGSICPKCNKGKLFNLTPGVVLRIVGQPWLDMHIYKPERLRCSVCQEVFTAKLPEELYTESRVDKTAKSIVSILKYRGGVPFYRQEQIQTIMNIPISDTEIWNMTRDVASHAEPIFTELCQLAANSDCIHNDDTGAKILEFMKENEKNPERKGIFTTALLAKKEDEQIALFFTGRQHAGENLNDILDWRDEGLPIPIQSCDALSRNQPRDHQTHTGYCNAHARRKFYEIASFWPQECVKVVSGFNLVFLNDKIAKQKNLTPQDRLEWHQQKSAPIMIKTREYCRELVDTKQAEPNSSLGKAIQYLENHWEGLTLFLRIPGVPISNNDDERLIKRAVLNRKNAYFFKNETGAKIADILMSIIETCVLNKVNPYNYLVAIQQYADRVLNDPKSWLPWNYEKALMPP
jgi:transposase